MVTPSVVVPLLPLLVLSLASSYHGVLATEVTPSNHHQRDATTTAATTATTTTTTTTATKHTTYYGDLVDEFDRTVIGKLASDTLDRALATIRDMGTTAASLAASEEEEEEEDPNRNYHGEDLIQWITSHGGMIHANARIGFDPTGRYRGVFVTTNANGDTAETTTTTTTTEGEETTPPNLPSTTGIEEGDIIARIPWDVIIKPSNYREDRFWNCEALEELYHQFQLGEEEEEGSESSTPYAPYVRYLKNQPRGRIPSEWTTAGRHLLYTLLDRHDDDDEGLPPVKDSKGYKTTWLTECGGEDTDLAKAAFYQFTSRDEDTLMVPFYDMCNHSNDPAKLNTVSEKPERPGLPFILRAIRDIHPGEQIYISYNRCHRCWYDKSYTDCVSYSHYGTSDIFDVFGFVEDFPQSWKFTMNVGGDGDDGDDEGAPPVWDTLKFCLTRDITDSMSEFVVSFGDNYTKDPNEEAPNMSTVVYLGNQLTRLVELEDKWKTDIKFMKSMPNYEWEMAWTYHRALKISISAALLASGLVGDTHLVQNEHDRREEDLGEDMEEDDRQVHNSSDDDDDEEFVVGDELEFVELDVGEGVMPTTEFTAELMDSADDDSEDSEDDTSDDYYEVIEVVPPLEDEQDEL